MTQEDRGFAGQLSQPLLLNATGRGGRALHLGSFILLATPDERDGSREEQQKQVMKLTLLITRRRDFRVKSVAEAIFTRLLLCNQPIKKPNI